MTTLTVRDVPEAVVRALDERATKAGHSLEEEVRLVLSMAADQDPSHRHMKPVLTDTERAALIADMQARFAHLRGTYSVDQFLEEKYREAAEEIAREDEWLSSMHPQS